jgi:lantibiotic modifying enzyme
MVKYSALMPSIQVDEILLNRASRMRFRDSHRVLLFLMPWNKACSTMVEAVEAFYQQCGQPRSVTPFEAILPVAQELAAKLDDFVAPVVCTSLPRERVMADRTEQNLLYRRLFLEASGQPTVWLQTVFDTYPFLKTLIDSVATNFAANVQTCLKRLAHSWSQLHKSGHLRDGLTSNLIMVNPTDSDGHCGGQRVLMLSFDDASKLVYKPFGAQCSFLFYQLLQSLQCGTLRYNLHGMRVELPTEQHESTYCWAEYVPHTPCLTHDDVHAYYYRAGCLTALCAALGFTDGHFGNIVARGPDPIIVDCETFFQPTEKHKGRDIVHLTMRSCLIQEMPEVFGSDSIWLAGFQHEPESRNASHAFSVSNDRTNLMSLIYDVGGSLEPCQSTPVLHGVNQFLSDFKEYFVEGFVGLWDLLRNRDLHASLLSWIQCVPGSTIRMVLRSTSLYVIALRNLQQASALRSHSDAYRIAQHAMSLNADIFSVGEVTQCSEVDALLRFDVPAFYCRAGECGEELTDCQGRTVKGQLLVLEAWQPTLLLDPPTSSEVEAAVGYLRQVLINDPRQELTVGHAGTLHCVAAIAEELTALLFLPKPLGISAPHGGLYSGFAGILLFYAALSVSELCTPSIKLAVQELAAAISTRRPPSCGCGGGFWGPASDAYALATAGALTGSCNLVTDAAQLCVDEVLLHDIYCDNVFDLTGGAAGCGLALLAVRQIANLFKLPADTVNKLDERIIACGNHLISSVIDNPSAVGWPVHGAVSGTEQSVIQAGFAHGNAGCVLALRRLGHFYSKPEWTRVAWAAAQTENQLCDPASASFKTLPLLQSGRTSSSGPLVDVAHDGSVAWCWGAPGIALSRIARNGGPPIPLPPLASWTGVFAVDCAELSLCCGTCGRVEMMMEAKAFVEGIDVSNCTQQIIALFSKQGSSAFEEHLRCGFMKGLSGLGYSLLRLRTPDRFPCILSLDWIGECTLSNSGEAKSLSHTPSMNLESITEET